MLVSGIKYLFLVLVFSVSVMLFSLNANSASNLNGDLKEAKSLFESLFPEEEIFIKFAGSSVVLKGNVSGAKAATQILEVAKGLFKGRNLINVISVKESQQVMMRVKIGEIRRSYIKNFSSRGNSIEEGEAAFTNLEQSGIFRTLAEPSLTAISGEKAKFLAGIEIPIPVPQGDDGVLITYKPVGINVVFSPLVISKNRIRIKVLSEISEIASNDAIINQGMKMPSISSRKASTTVELAPGESFMIAGLVKDNNMSGLKKVPGMSEIPLLGKLFQSSSFKDNKTELVIAVTPYIVYPVESKEIVLPTDGIEAKDLKEMLFYKAVQNNSKDKKSDKSDYEKLEPEDLKFEGEVGFSLD